MPKVRTEINFQYIYSLLKIDFREKYEFFIAIARMNGYTISRTV